MVDRAEKIEAAAVVQTVGQSKKQVAPQLLNAKQAILAISNQRWILFEQGLMSGRQSNSRTANSRAR